MPRPVYPKWTDEMIQFVRENYRILTGPELIQRLYEISGGRELTRSAIMGKVWRLGLCEPESKIAPEPKQAKRRNNKFNTKRSKSFKKPSAEQVKLWATNRKLKRNGALYILDLHDHNCRWPMGEVKDLMFCGKQTVHLSSWCAEHHKIVYPQGYKGGRP